MHGTVPRASSCSRESTSGRTGTSGTAVATRGSYSYGTPLRDVLQVRHPVEAGPRQPRRVALVHRVAAAGVVRLEVHHLIAIVGIVHAAAAVARPRLRVRDREVRGSGRIALLTGLAVGVALRVDRR